MSITNSWSLPKLMSIESVMPSNHLILCCPLLLLPLIFPSNRVFSNESAFHIRWPKYWSFSFNISPSSEHPGLISFRMDWLDLLAVRGTLKSLLQHPLSMLFFWVLSHSVMSSSLQPHGLWPDRLLSQWDFSGKNTIVGCYFFLQGIFLTPESNPLLMNLLHCKWILYCWATGETLLLVKKTSLTYPNLNILPLSFGDSDKHLSNFYFLQMYLVLESVSLMTWIRQGMSIITACVQHCKGSFIDCKSQENLYEAQLGRNRKNYSCL